MAQGGIGGGEKYGQIYQMKFFFFQEKKGPYVREINSAQNR